VIIRTIVNINQLVHIDLQYPLNTIVKINLLTYYVERMEETCD